MGGMKAQFTLRDLLWLTVVVGLAVGWRLDHRTAWSRAAMNEHHANHAWLLKRQLEYCGFEVTLNDNGSVKYVPPVKIK